MHRLTFVALLFGLGLAQSASLEATKKEERYFPLFNVVAFQNLECTAKDSTTATKGTCFSSSECTSKGGTADGNCAAGFGVCCLFVVTASTGTVSQNNTYIQNANFPTVIAVASTTTTHTYTVNPFQTEICQLRLDLDTFILEAGTTATNLCIATMTLKSPTGDTTTPLTPPQLCGTLSGDHVYVETGASTSTTSIEISTASITVTATWNIRVSQIGCDQLWKAPQDCFQYYTGQAGIFRSFNHMNGILQRSLDYSICFRQEMGYCSITYGVDIGTTTPDPYSLPPTIAAITAAFVDETCTLSRINVPHVEQPNTVNTDTTFGQLCGTELSTVALDDTSGTVTQSRAPFTINVQTSNAAALGTAANPAIGFKMTWIQNSC